MKLNPKYEQNSSRLTDLGKESFPRKYNGNNRISWGSD